MPSDTQLIDTHRFLSAAVISVVYSISICVKFEILNVKLIHIYLSVFSAVNMSGLTPDLNSAKDTTSFWGNFKSLMEYLLIFAYLQSFERLDEACIFCETLLYKVPLFY